MENYKVSLGPPIYCKAHFFIHMQGWELLENMADWERSFIIKTSSILFSMIVLWRIKRGNWARIRTCMWLPVILTNRHNRSPPLLKHAIKGNRNRRTFLWSKITSAVISMNMYHILYIFMRVWINVTLPMQVRTEKSNFVDEFIIYMNISLCIYTLYNYIINVYLIIIPIKILHIIDVFYC